MEFKDTPDPVSQEGRTEKSKTHRPRVMILTPVYNEEGNLPFFEREVTEILLLRPDYDFRVLFIDDGSVDRSWPIIQEICARNSRFRGIRMSKNFGSHVALSAGFLNGSGDAFATLACDLQDPPEVILEFLEKWSAGARIVSGRRLTREDDIWRIGASRVFDWVLRRYTSLGVSNFTTGSFLLVDRQVAECLRQFNEQHRITFALVAWTGFTQVVVDYNRRPRVRGVTGWTFRKMVKTMYDAFIGFSEVPIRLMKFAGIGLFLISMIFSVHLVILWLTGDPVRGWPSLMFALTMFFGIQFSLMGIMGEYLYRIYSEVVKRPLFIISEETGAGWGWDGESAEASSARADNHSVN
jgi:dolichol-phosphate mannosyltransferase